MKAVCARFGFKKVYIKALSGFFICSLLMKVSWSIGILMISGILQDAFSGILMPTTITLIYQRVDKRRQAFGMSLWSMSLALAPAVGPVLAGFLIDLFDWRALFCFNSPIVVGVIVITLKYLSKTGLSEKPALIFGDSSFLLAAVCSCWRFCGSRVVGLARQTDNLHGFSRGDPVGLICKKRVGS